MAELSLHSAKRESCHVEEESSESLFIYNVYTELLGR